MSAMPADEDAPGMRPAPVEVPWQDLSAAALRGIIEAFVLREGTDYGAIEASFESKVAAIQRQVEQGEVRVFFEPGSRTVELVPTHGRRAHGA